jgi:hypothetical protein
VRRDAQPRPAVLAALARFVDEERPIYWVDRLVAMGSHRSEADALVLAFGPRGRAARLALPARTLAALPPAPPAADPAVADTPVAEAPAPPCAWCGGETRVVLFDLVEDMVTSECRACGLRRIEAAEDQARPA